MMKSSTVIFVVLLGIATTAVDVWFLFGDRRATVARLADAEIGEVRVLGESEDRFEEWSFRLSWRKGNGAWMEYLLDRQVGLWSDVELIRLTNTIVIKRHGEIVGTLNTRDGSFSDKLCGRLEFHPQVIVTNDNPFDRTSRIYAENPTWPSIWPKVLLQSR